MSISDVVPAQRTRSEDIRDFVGINAAYYETQFAKIDDTRRLITGFNVYAVLLGPYWWITRHLWAQFWVFLALETFAIVNIFRGLFADLGVEKFARAERLAQSAADRRAEAEAAAASDASNADSLAESASALETASQKALADAEAIAATGPYLLVTGLILLVALKLVQGLAANRAVKGRFQNWRANRAMAKGINVPQLVLMSAFGLVTMIGTAYRFTASNVPAWLSAFPASSELRRNVEGEVDVGFQWLTENFSDLFGGITNAIRFVLDCMEVLLVGTPWPIVMGVIILLAVKIAGVRVAIFTAAALAYLAFLGFWEQSMLTVALLGSACLICLLIGIPLGVLCARKQGARAVVWPILDLMQTMPSFVYLIPVIAFFGIGKPPGIIATIVFGMPPVVRLTVLGLRGVPAAVREAAEAFGASKSYMLFRVDLPLAMPSIMTGVNQTTLMCLSMVVIASLIGAKGLGEDVLDALTYASEGKGVLAGLAILFCAMVLDRIVQGKSAQSNKEKT